MNNSIVFSLPNLLTYGRILAVPAMAACFYFPGTTSNWVALAIFVTAALTDFLDGYLARAWKQQSKLGRMLDPIADKLLVSVSLLVLTHAGIIGQWSLIAAIIILCREILVSGLREFLAELQVSVPVTKLAKWKTTVQLVAIGFLIVGPAGDAMFPYTTHIGIALLWLAAILTLYTGYDYFRVGMKHLIDG
ncbi:CDP-diacylglycerol--glycerol-3-phosphate 3-phosphatidyltransferase [Rhodobacteraceae bacterium RKSG542]|uniref:CDP-diacylglycerol--glycerol-3-phosphate 3-phosphatidyltransferase n=1 Tax=Pseudovibrio flavus TaxID=2529854 RepID=UPI0012BB73E3|nr:CDP-diacylglycerol--glycerol-3-phosphate 3-phosphatidyltransferase [Pseudovibrio flavus]MTI19039.1 CDP-diacylglycerol--glycerol-3-phosphate 3-phosphatidyltransferase [Pseudovibrio flavus]